MISLYAHIPFCRRKCGYCDFLSMAEPDEETVTRYVGALTVEMSRRGGRPLRTIYVGGGTPSLLTGDRTEELFRAVGGHFDLSGLEETTLEANPESVAEGLPELWMRCGVDRISLGVQSFQDDVLESWNRVTRTRDTDRALRLLKHGGFDNINLDLILGLRSAAGLSGAGYAAGWRRELENALASGPAHISVYMLTLDLYGAAPGGFAPPPDRLLEELYVDTVAYLGEEGYLQYEISNFAKRGMQSRHNLAYWQGLDYIGVGLGAVSTVNRRRWKNLCALDSYLDSIERQRSAEGEVEEITGEISFAESVMLGLRTVEGIDLGSLGDRKSDERVESLLEEILHAGYGTLREGRLALTPRGFFRSNAMISKLLSLII